MAHFAELDESGVVTRVLVVANPVLLDNGVESEQKGVDFLASLYGHSRWVQTSYNGTIRWNYAAKGYTYDRQRDAFIPPSPYPSWVLDDASCRWVSPVPHPDDGGRYVWDESSAGWKPVSEG